MPEKTVPKAVITSWENPEDRLRFLEETLRGKDWRARIIYPVSHPNAAASYARTRRMLEARGFIVTSERNAEGDLALELHHLGSGTRLSDIVAEAGVFGAIGHMLRHPLIPLSRAVKRTQRTIDKADDIVKDPAQTNGFVFTVAEACLTLAGLGNESGAREGFLQKMRQPRNFLQSLGGALYLGQSLTYLTLAKSNDQRSFEQVRDKVVQLSQKDKSVLDVHYDPATDQPKTGFVQRLGDFFRTYPIQIGVIANNLGGLAYMGHAVYTRRYYREHLYLDGAAHYITKGFRRDIGGALTSIFAWTLLLLPSHRKEKDAPEHAHADASLAQRAVQYMKDNPETGTGLLTIASSTQRLMGSIAKGNKIQAVGESIYLPGDFLLLFTKNSEYGDHTQHNREALAAKIANFVDRMPVVMGSHAQKEFVTNITRYLRDKTLAAQAASPGATPISEAELDQRAEQLAKTIQKNLREKKNDPLDNLAEATAALVLKFPHHLRAQVTRQLTTTLAQMPWVYATSQELHHAITEVPEPVGRHVSRLPQMRELSHDIRQITETVRGIDRAAAASALYEALRTHLTPPSTPTPQIISASMQHQVAAVQPSLPSR
jgi:hypothetical protein